MKIGIIGSGEMGCCLASAFKRLGHEVSIANSRGPETLTDIALNTGAVPVTVADVIKGKDIVVVSMPVKNIPELPVALFRSLLEHTIVIDTGNYYPTLRDGHIQSLERHGIDSLWVQEELGVPIVKAFNAILATSIKDLAKPKDDNQRIAVPVAGDNVTSKIVISGLLDAMGFDAFDAGDIHQSWKLQPGSPIYCRDITLEEMKRRALQFGVSGLKMQNIFNVRTVHEALMKSDYSAYLKILT